MGITHHSNYIRWMEEARVDFMAKIGWPYDRMEEEGIASPVLAVNAKYKTSTTFGDNVRIDVRVAEYNGLRLIIGYRMEKLVDAAVQKEEHNSGTSEIQDAAENWKLVCEGTTEHCFVGKDGKLLKLKRDFPEFHKALTDLLSEE